MGAHGGHGIPDHSDGKDGTKDMGSVRCAWGFEGAYSPSAAYWLFKLLIVLVLVLGREKDQIALPEAFPYAPSR